MKKFLIGFFLLLSAFLGGYYQSEAHAFRINTRDALAEIPGKSAHAGLDDRPEGMACVHKPATSHQDPFKTDPKEVREEKEEDEDDREYFSLKKHAGGSDYFSSILLARSIGYFFSPGKAIPVGCKYFSYTASHRYLVLQVFRI